jgi:hypothetical protein
MSEPLNTADLVNNWGDLSATGLRVLVAELNRQGALLERLCAERPGFEDTGDQDWRVAADEAGFVALELRGGQAFDLRDGG